MRLAVCPICGLASGPSDTLCRKCGNALVPPRQDMGTGGLQTVTDEPSETYKFVALGVFIGCLVAGCFVLWLMIGTSHAAKPSNDQPGVKGLSVTPQSTTPLGTSSDPATDSSDADHASSVVDKLKSQHRRRSDGPAQKSSGYGKAEVYTGRGKTPTMVEPE